MITTTVEGEIPSATASSDGLRIQVQLRSRVISVAAEEPYVAAGRQEARAHVPGVTHWLIVDMSVADAAELRDALGLAIREARRGRRIDNDFAWCIGCGENRVCAAHGVDTCHVCVLTR